ncbi:MAG: response regulator transcription factor [Spirochaetes bacterium]|nr:response regulator transcription factor [Spirochaetota bacterium]MBN2771291.1 response regulator transcription factor [Spirochaetota bacterium]
MLGNKTSVFIVDDHEMIIPGLKMAIESLDNFNVAGCSSNGLEALNLIKQCKPDIVLSDLSMPGFNGFEILSHFRANNSKIKFIFLTSYSDDKYVRQALKLGVEGYILKENSPDDLFKALETVSKGLKYITPKIMTRIVDGLDLDSETDEDFLASDSLTGKEREVMSLITGGKSTREICRILEITEATLKTHKSNIMRKLGVKTTGELIVYYNEHKMFTD